MPNEAPAELRNSDLWKAEWVYWSDQWQAGYVDHPTAVALADETVRFYRMARLVGPAAVQAARTRAARSLNIPLGESGVQSETPEQGTGVQYGARLATEEENAKLSAAKANGADFVIESVRLGGPPRGMRIVVDDGPSVDLRWPSRIPLNGAENILSVRLADAAALHRGRMDRRPFRSWFWGEHRSYFSACGAGDLEARRLATATMDLLTDSEGTLVTGEGAILAAWNRARRQTTFLPTTESESKMPPVEQPNENEGAAANGQASPAAAAAPEVQKKRGRKPKPRDGAGNIIRDPVADAGGTSHASPATPAAAPRPPKATPLEQVALEKRERAARKLVDELREILSALAPWERLPTVKAALAASFAEDEARRLANELTGRPYDFPFVRPKEPSGYSGIVQDEDAKATRETLALALARIDWNLLGRSLDGPRP